MFGNITSVGGDRAKAGSVFQTVGLNRPLAVWTAPAGAVKPDTWFTAEVTEPIFNKGEEVVPGGSAVEGRVSFVRPPGRAKGVAEMRLTPEKISVPSGAQYLISAALEGAEGAPDVKVVDEEGTLKGKGKSKKTTAEEAGIGVTLVFVIDDLMLEAVGNGVGVSDAQQGTNNIAMLGL